MARRGTFCCLAVLVLGVGACDIGEAHKPAHFALQEIRRYGWVEPRDGDDTGVLGGVTEVAEGDNGRLYVLDQRGEKVVIFRLNGEVEGSIRLRQGEGPGEFRIPRDLAITPDGDIAILDANLSRVVVFTVTGDVKRTVAIRAAAPLQLAFAQGKLWTSHSAMPGEDKATLRSWDSEREAAVDAVSLSGMDRAFGGSGDLVTTKAGVLLRNLRMPGVWWTISHGDIERTGQELVEGLQPPLVTRNPGGSPRIDQPRAWSDGIGANGSGEVYQTYVELPFAPTADRPADRNRMVRWLAVFDDVGELVARSELPPDVNSLRLVSSTNGHLFFGVSDPYPQVVEYAVSITYPPE